MGRAERKMFFENIAHMSPATLLEMFECFVRSGMGTRHWKLIALRRELVYRMEESE